MDSYFLRHSIGDVTCESQEHGSVAHYLDRQHGDRLPRWIRPETFTIARRWVKIANLNFKLKLAHLQTLAGTLYLQSSERNYGLAAQTSSQFFDQLRTLTDQVNDPKLNQILMELSKSQGQITAGLANGDPAVLPKIAELLQKTLSTETL